MGTSRKMQHSKSSGVSWDLLSSQRSMPRQRSLGSLSPATVCPCLLQVKPRRNCWGWTLSTSTALSQSELLLPVPPAVAVCRLLTSSSHSSYLASNWVADTILLLVYAGPDSLPVLFNLWPQQKSMAGDDCCFGGWQKPERATQAVIWEQSSECCAGIRLGFLRNNNIGHNYHPLQLWFKKKKKLEGEGRKRGNISLLHLSCGMMAQLSISPVIITSEIEKNTVKMIGQSVCIACYTKGYYFSLDVYLPLENF